MWMEASNPVGSSKQYFKLNMYLIESSVIPKSVLAEQLLFVYGFKSQNKILVLDYFKNEIHTLK